MDLLSITRKIWRYKLVTLPVVLLTLCGAVYVVAVKQPVYEASSSYVLINPPDPPTPEEIAREPALGRINSHNPYTRFSDQSVVAELLSSAMASESAQRALASAGADSRYTVAPTPQVDRSSPTAPPIVEITAQGSSPRAATRTAKLVGNAVTRELGRMQAAEGVDSRYRIETRQVDEPDGAQRRASGQLRMLIGVLGLGAVLLVVVVSVANALATLRMERRERAAPSLAVANELPWSTHSEPGERLPDLAEEENSSLSGDSLVGDEPVGLFAELDQDARVPGNDSRIRHLPNRRESRASNG